jgi:hypothetical protein
MHKVNEHADFILSQCLFGLHLLGEPDFNMGKKEVIRVVESEKTALILFGLQPEYLYMATGSNGNFKESMLKPLKGYRVEAFPDKSEYENWIKEASKLNQKGYNIKVSRLLENTDLEEGSDLIDLLIKT